MKIDPKDIPGKGAPWDYPGFIVCEGRHIADMGCIGLPKGHQYPHGADVTYMIWRFEATPNEWVLTYRFRTYAGPNSDPFKGGDRKTWHGAKVDTLEKARVAMTAIARAAQLMLNGGTAVPHDILRIDGGPDEFFKIMDEAKPSWMHIQKHTITAK